VTVTDKSLEHAVLEKKKDHAFLLGNASEKYLFNAPDKESRSRWIGALSKSQKPGLSGETTAMVPENQQPVVAAPTPTPTPSAQSSQHRRNKSNGQPLAVEELATKGEKKKWGGIRSTLNRYLSSRPDKEELLERGIIAEVIFGGCIDSQVAVEASAFPDKIKHVNVPQVVVKCVTYVDQYLNETGIYRVNGNASKMQKLAAECNEDVFSVDIANVPDLHAVSGLLKLYFRELQEPLFTDALYDQLVESAKIQDKNTRLQTLKGLVQALPPSHIATLHFLCQHMLRVVDCASSNKMRMNNMAIVFGPTLLRKSQPTMDNIIKDSPFQSSVVEDILSQLAWFMDGVTA